MSWPFRLQASGSPSASVAGIWPTSTLRPPLSAMLRVHVAAPLSITGAWLPRVVPFAWSDHGPAPSELTARTRIHLEVSGLSQSSV